MGYLKMFLFISLLGSPSSRILCAVGSGDDQLPTAVVLELTTACTSQTKTPIEGEGHTCTQHLKARFLPGKLAQKQTKVWTMHIVSWKWDQKNLGDGSTVRLDLPWNNDRTKNDALQKITTTAIPVLVRKDGTVEKVERPAALDNIGDVPEEARPYLMALLCKPNLAVLAQVALQTFPRNLATAKPGDQWTKKSQTILPLSGLINDGSFHYGGHYTVQKIDGRRVFLQVATTFKHVAGKKQGEPLSLKVEMTKVQSKGTIVVDRKTKRVITCDLPLHAVGTWHVEGDRQRVTGRFQVSSRLRLHTKSR